MDKTIRITMNDSMSPCLRQQAHRVLPDAVQSVIRQTYVQAPKKRCHPTKHRMRSAMLPTVSSVIFFHAKRNPRKTGWHPEVLVGLPARSPRLHSVAFVLLMPDRESARPPRRHRSRSDSVHRGSVRDPRRIPFTDKTFLFRFFL